MTMPKMLKRTILLAVLVFAMGIAPQSVKAAPANGLQMASDGNWYYYVNGVVDTNYTGLACNDYGWWYVRNGVLDWSYTGMACNDYGWWYVTNGALDWNYTGMACNDYGWWYITNGALDWGYTGMACNEAGWWYYTNGALDWGYTGMACNDYGWWYITNGALDWGYIGMACNDYGWWYITNGALDWGYTGMACNEAGWWYYTNGALDWGFTGIGYNEAGAWYFQNGYLDFGFSGTVTYQGVTYEVVNGAATEKGGNSTYELGQQSTGTLQSGIYIIQSAKNKNYALTVSPDATAEGGYNVYMSKIDGGNDQKFQVIKLDNGTYMMMSLQYKDANNVGWLLNAANFGWSEASGSVDNVQLTADSVMGGKTWTIQETSSGNYTIMIKRDDDWKFYVTANGAPSEGANVGTAEATNATNQQFCFVSPYKKTLEDGTYTISSSTNTGYSVAIADYSVADGAGVVLKKNSYGTDQNYKISCVDATKGIYRVQNTNSNRYLDVNTSQTAGTALIQNLDTNVLDQQWYIQKNTDGTYSFISALTNQYMTVGGNVADGTAMTQNYGFDAANQKFYVNAQISGNEVLDTGLYTIGSEVYRLQSLGNGIYSIFCVNTNTYCKVNDDGSYAAGTDGTTAAEKWIITQSGSKYLIKSAVANVYLKNGPSVSTAKTELSVVDATGTVKDYSKRYDLSALNNAFLDTGLQIQTRLNTLGLSMESLMSPETGMENVNSSVESAMASLPTEVVYYEGNDVDELNTFLRSNQGKVVKLTQDIQVYKEGTTHLGTIMLPPNTVLDGDGHSLVMKNGYTEAPENAILFHSYNASTQKFELASNSGVKNLKTSIAYNISVGVLGASNVLIENNYFANSVSHCISLSTDEGISSNVKISNNTIENIGGDGIAVAGAHSNIVISGNTITNCAGRAGITVSCIEGDNEPVRVDQETTGPHDINVCNNNLNGFSTGCAVYCVGAYRTYFTGNKLQNAYHEGICFDSGCIGCYFAGNEVFNTSLQGGLPGVSIDNGVYNIIDGNKIHDNACTGIKLVRAGVGNIIVNNICYDNSTNKVNPVNGADYSAGIALYAAKVDAVDGDKLDGTGSNGNVIINNTICGAHDYGISIIKDSETGSTKGNFVGYNSVSSEYQYGLTDFSSGSNTIRDNILMN